MTDQLALDAPDVPEHRVMALAGVLAGFRWPEHAHKHDGFKKLKKWQKQATLDVARLALETLARQED